MSPINETKFKYYSFDLKRAVKANPRAIECIWNDGFGVHYKFSANFETLPHCCEIRDDRLLLGKAAANTHGLIWDHVDMDSNWNHLKNSEDLPIDVRQKMTTGYFGDLTGSDFCSIPCDLRKKFYESLEFHVIGLNEHRLETAFHSSYLFSWARTQIKAGRYYVVSA